MGIPMHVDQPSGKHTRTVSESSDDGECLQTWCRFRNAGGGGGWEAYATDFNSGEHRDEQQDTGNETVSEDEDGPAGDTPAPVNFAAGRPPGIHSNRSEPRARRLPAYAGHDQPADRAARRAAEEIRSGAGQGGRVTHPENTLSNVVRLAARAGHYAAVRRSGETERLRNDGLTAVFDALRQQSNRLRRGANRLREQFLQCPPLPAAAVPTAPAWPSSGGGAAAAAGSSASRSSGFARSTTAAPPAASGQRPPRAFPWQEPVSPPASAALARRAAPEPAAVEGRGGGEGGGGASPSAARAPAADGASASSPRGAPPGHRGNTATMSARALSRWRNQSGAARSTAPRQGSFPPAAFVARGAAPPQPAVSSAFTGRALAAGNPAQSIAARAQPQHIPRLRLHIGESGFATVAVADEPGMHLAFRQVPR
ncbi:MAG: hypothetical protein BJ554DRAFT_4330 [Olpidium bornovanus]|uniref:Uncharacterized protein n=1 Tax=Olpidium bornovanus TaxID=278681 RepID=A0A8H8DEU1_9FUNG|nr:MAG: hypothetical protein BJ554DRAFT_4330 [Olpidium bornovanus]